MDYRRIITGRRGEDIAVEHLSRHGYRIIARNYRCRQGEIDIIAMDGGVLAFIEVKTRSSDRFGRPAEAVDAGKQGRIAHAALKYMADEGLTDAEARFDVVSIITGGDEDGAEIIKDAFEWSE